MRIQPDHLLALIHVARTGSLTQTAHQLGRTQPAISAQMKRLAEVVGEPLITRQRYGVTLTSAGKALLPSAQALARSLDIALEVSDRLRGVKQGSLRVLTSTTVAVYILPPLLARFHERYPGIDLQLQHCTPEEATHQLIRNDADLAVVRAPIGVVPADFVSSLLMTDETILAVLPDHALVSRRNLRVEDLDGLEVVVRGYPSPTRKLVDHLAQQAGVAFRVRFEVGTIEALKEAIRQGFGGGFLSRLAVAREVRAGRLAALRLHHSALVRQIFLIHPAATQSSPRVRAFLEVMGELPAPDAPAAGLDVAAESLQRRPL